MDKITSKTGGKVDFKKLMKASIHDEIKIGFPDGMTHNSGKIDIDEIALYNSEPERSSMPERPFLQDGIKSELENIDNEIKKQYMSMIKGKSPDYHKIAVMAINAVQEFVRGDTYKATKPNAKSTIRRKTSKKGKKTGMMKDKPLIATGQTINSITYTIEKD
jgi:hypothetical protein